MTATATVRSLMTEGAVFLPPDAEPFGKEAFANPVDSPDDVEIDATDEVQEVQIAGDWAFMRARPTMAVTKGTGPPVRRSGYTLTVLRPEPDGRWRLARDANLVTADDCPRAC